MKKARTSLWMQQAVWTGILAGMAMAAMLGSCTKSIIIDLPASDEQLAVEGHIETGQPPYVILTRTTDYYATLYLNEVEELFVKNALIRVSDGTDTITLTEITVDTSGTAVSVYVGLGMIGQEGKTYSLWIEAEGQTLSAKTSIPFSIPLDSIWWEPASDSPDDTLVRLICRYSDPPDPGQYVRYFTKQNSDEFYPGLNSVFEDDLVNGETFDFPLDRGINRNDSTSFDDYGLFNRGDTITVLWSNIDRAHFDFWRTLEYELGSQGSPFAAPVFIQDNVEGGIGIWGGYAPSFLSLIVPE